MPWSWNPWQTSAVVQQGSHLQPLNQPTFPHPFWMEMVDTVVQCKNCGVDFGEILPCAAHITFIDTCKCNSGLPCLLHEPRHYYAWASYLAQAKYSKIHINFGRAPPAATSRYPSPVQSAIGILMMCLLSILFYQVLYQPGNGFGQ